MGNPSNREAPARNPLFLDRGSFAPHQATRGALPTKNPHLGRKLGVNHLEIVMWCLVKPENANDSKIELWSRRTLLRMDNNWVGGSGAEELER